MHFPDFLLDSAILFVVMRYILKFFLSVLVFGKNIFSIYDRKKKRYENFDRKINKDLEMVYLIND